MALAPGRLEPRQVIGHRARQHDGQLRASRGDRGDDRRELGELPPLIGTGRVTGAHEERVRSRIEQGPNQVQAVCPVERDRARPPAAQACRPGERLCCPGGDRADDDLADRCAPGDEAWNPAGEPGQVGEPGRPTRGNLIGTRAGGPRLVELLGDPETRGQLGIGCDDASDQLGDEAVAVGTGGHREGADQSPAPVDSTDQGGGRGGGAEVEGEEGARFARHRTMLPANARPGVTPDERSQRAGELSGGRSGVPGDLFVDLLEPRDQQLDSGLVGEDLGRRRVVAAEEAAEDRVKEEHRVGAERAVRSARLEEVDGGPGQATELDLAGDPFHQLVALVLRPLIGEAHARTVPSIAAGAAGSTGRGR